MTSEQEIQEMQEKIKNMSPEELREYQKQQCIFCHIVNGKVQSRKIYEDEECMAVLDINPANPGHLLVVPKEHFAIMPVIPEATIKHLFMITKQLSKAVLQGLQAQGTTIFVANGVAAGQKSQHFMIHVIPRMEGDGIGIMPSARKESKGKLAAVKTVLREKIYRDLGIKDPESGMHKEHQEMETAGSHNKEKKHEQHTTENHDEGNNQEEREEQENPPEQQKEEGVTLDDIARFITGKK